MTTVPSLIAEFFSWAQQIGRVYNCTPLIPDTCYRGHGCTDWKLLPTLCRDRTHFSIELLKQDEKDIVAEFRSRFQLQGWTVAEVMAYAQHHGAPTRLLDWTRNPLIGLWFAVSEKIYDKCNGTIYQLRLPPLSKVIIAMTEPPQTLIAGEDFEGESKVPIRVFSSPPRIERTERQSSVFSLANFGNDYVIKPLEDILKLEESKPLRTFTVPAELKLELRGLLLDLGLDAYSIYGGPDSLGKSITSRLYPPPSNVSVDLRARQDCPLAS